MRFGLGAIRNVGEQAVNDIIEERNGKRGKYVNFLDFVPVRGRMRLVERVARERHQDVPHRLRGLLRVAVFLHAREERDLLAGQHLGLLLAHRAAQHVRLAQRIARQDARALKNIAANGKDPIDYTKIPLDDRGTYELLSRGDTLGVFQLDSDGMRALLKSLKPDNFNDISALIALYRPGPMDMDSHNNYAKRKNGLQQITPIHPEVAPCSRGAMNSTG